MSQYSRAWGGLRVPSLYTIGFVSIIVAIFFRSIALEIDLDLWWHLANGRRMVEMGDIVLPEWMSFTFAGERFVNQWWLGELLFYGLYSTMGMWSIFIFTSLVIAGSFVFVYLRMKQRGAAPAIALTILTFGAIASAVSWGTRLQMVSLFFASLFLWMVDRHERSGSAKWLIPLPLLMIVWNNIQGAFVIGVAVLAIYSIAAWLERDRARAPQLTIAFAATALASIVSPNGVLQWRYPLEFFFPNPYRNMIEESLSPDFHLKHFLPFEGLLILLAVSAIWARPERKWRDALLVIGFTHLALSQIRHISLWVIAVSPLIADYATVALRSAMEGRPALTRINREPSRKMRDILNAVLIVAVIIAFQGVFSRALERVDLEESERAWYPAGAADHIAARPSPERTFSTFEWGGYLAWRLYPKQTVFIDARADIIYDERVLMDYVAIMGQLPGWQSRLEEWNIEQFVVPRGSDVDYAMEREPSWERTYSDHNAAVYVRRNGR